MNKKQEWIPVICSVRSYIVRFLKNGCTLKVAQDRPDSHRHQQYHYCGECERML